MGVKEARFPLEDQVAGTSLTPEVVVREKAFTSTAVYHI